MCWVALDRAIALADVVRVIEDPSRVADWRKARDETADTILGDG